MKKALFISYYFPPVSSAYSLRVLKFAKQLAKHDWQPIIITDTPKSYYFKDNFLLDEAERSSLRIERTKGSKKNLLTGSKLQKLPNEGKLKLIRNIKRLFKLPDEQKVWINKCVKLCSEIIEREKISVLYATAPPFSSFVAAAELKEKYGIPLVIDYQDSWLHSATNNFYLGYHKLRNVRMEMEVLRVADEVLTANRRIKENIISEYIHISHKDINVMLHGIDFIDFNVKPKPRDDSRIRFTYAGTFFDYRSPKYFFEALSMVFKKKPELRKKIDACLVGTLSRENLQLIKKFGIADVITNPGFVNHSECMSYLLSSDVLWFTINKDDGDDAISPVKLSEYFGARKPILGLVSDGAAKQLLKEYESVKICEPDDPEEISNMIIEYCGQFESRTVEPVNEAYVRNFDIVRQSYQLVRYFEFLIDINPEFDIIGREELRQSINTGYDFL